MDMNREPNYKSLYLMPKRNIPIDVRFSFDIVDENNKSLRKFSETRARLNREGLGWDEFIMSSENEEYLYLRDNTLSLVCEVEIFGKVLHHIHDRFVSFSDDTFSGDFYRLLDYYSTDVEFRVLQKKIRAHKIILSARSNFFRAIFSSGMKEASNGVVEIVDISMTIFRFMLKYMYSGKYEGDISLQNVEEVLYAASKYYLVGPKILCEKVLYENLNINTLPKIHELSQKYLLKSLRGELMKYITQNHTNFEKFCLKKESFKEMCRSDPELCLYFHPTAISPDLQTKPSKKKKQFLRFSKS